MIRELGGKYCLIPCGNFYLVSTNFGVSGGQWNKLILITWIKIVHEKRAFRLRMTNHSRLSMSNKEH